MPYPVVRFGVLSTDRTRRSSTWRLWTVGDSELYFSSRQLGGALKLSMHRSGQWHIAFDNLNRLFEPENAPASRFLDTWTAKDFRIPGLFLGCRLWVPFWAVSSPAEPLDPQIAWVPQPAEARMIEFAVFIADADHFKDSWPGRNSMDTRLLSSFCLRNGQVVWLVWRDTELVVPKIPSQVPTASMRYMRGASEADLSREGLYMLTWAFDSSGSPIFFSVPVTIRKNEA